MAPQQKNSKKTGLEKKTTLKKTLPKKTISKKMATKTAPKRTAPKKTALISPTKRVSPTKAPSKKTPSKKTGAKVVSPMRKPLKKAALKEKIALKSAKVKLVGKKAISKSGEERAARATRRSLAKEAPAVKEPLLKKARLDSSCDLVNLLTTSAPVRHIFAASGSRHLTEVSSEATCGEALGEGPFMDDSFELDHLLRASQSSAEVLDICDASGSRPLPEEAVGMAEAALVDVPADSNFDAFADPSVSAASDSLSPEEILADVEALEKAQSAGATLKGLMERVLEDTLSMQTSEEASGEAATTGPTFLEEIIATTTSGGRGSSFDGFPTPTIPNEGASPSGFQVDPQGSLAAQNDTPSKNRPKKVFLSPALIWLEEEGLTKAEAENQVFGGEMEEEELTRMAMEIWRKMGVEEKAVWRKRAKEAESTFYANNF